MAPYFELYLPGGQAITKQAKLDAKGYVNELGWIELEANRELDSRLLNAAQRSSDPLPLLCLRCRVSKSISSRLRVMHQKHQEQHELELQDMAACVLDDGGEIIFRQKSRDADGTVKQQRLPFTWETIKALPEREIRPFAADILRSYNPSRCALPTWAETRVQGHSELKQYLRSCGLLLISSWALLADTSPTRIKEAWEQCGEGEMTAAEAVDLHTSYLKVYWPAKEAYKSVTGKSSGWIPDDAFLLSLSPPQQDDQNLRKLDQSIRRLLAQRPRSFKEGEEDSLADSSSLEEIGDDSEAGAHPSDLQTSILRALEIAAHPRIKAAIEADQKKWERDPTRKMAWELYSKGIGQREIAERCTHKQGWVSKLLQEKTLSHAIALDAAIDLIRLPAFHSLQMNPSGTEKMVEALRNHLINPEQEGDIAPLRQWIQILLTRP